MRFAKLARIASTVRSILEISRGWLESIDDTLTSAGLTTGATFMSGLFGSTFTAGLA